MMAEAGLDNRTLVKRTLITAGAMVGACVVIVGTLTLVASSIVGHAVVPSGEASGGDGGAATAHVAAPPAGRSTTPNAR